VRGQNRDTLVPELHQELQARPRKLLLERLSRVGIPCGEVLGLHEALTSPRAESAGLVTQQPHPVAGCMHVMAPPYRLDGERLPVRTPPPVLGEGTREILQGLLGLDEDRLAELERLGVTRKS
jgi:crotonobetainyl-CoA:carnitine CoA-transferase CaiB-like acyl-CoA transferase